MASNITELLMKELDQIKSIDNKKELCDLLDNCFNDSNKKNSLGQKFETIKNTFIRDLKRIKSKEINKKKVIKLILELEISDFELIKKIYNLSGHPFDYEDEALSDIFDEALRLFINEDLYKNILEDTYEAAPTLLKGEKQSHFDRYKICIHRTLEFYIEKNKKVRKNTNIKSKKHLQEERYNEFLEDLFLEIYFSNDTDENDDNIFYESDSLEDIEKIYDEFLKSLCKTTTKYITLEQFKYVILLGLVEQIFKPNLKSSNMVRTTLDNAKRNYILQSLIDIINFDDEFSHGILLSNYEQMFLNNNIGVKNQLFIDYFTDIIKSLRNVVKGYKELDDLSDESIVTIVTKYKNALDKVSKK